MKVIKFFLFISLLAFISSCGSVKKAFTNQKKVGSDEFLVQKKSPLVMPPDYDQLPIPEEMKTNNQDIEQASEIKDLINENENENEDNNTKLNQNFEENLINKIKKN